MLLIGAEILKYRKAANMNQEEFAAKIGVSRQAVSKWELDKAYPDLDKLMDICTIFGITLDELVHGKIKAATEPDPETDKNINRHMAQKLKESPVLECNMTSVGKLRKNGSRIRLILLALLTGMLFLFCGSVFAVMLSRHAWNTEYMENTRVERVYRQYTKADVSFYDDEGRKVLKTLWLDIEGIRDGDYIECFTDGKQSGIYYDYYLPTMLVPGVCALLFLLTFLFICLELRRLGKEDKWHVLIEEGMEKGTDKENVQDESEAAEDRN